MREVPLTRGKVAIVDDEDYHLVIRYKWQCITAGRGYASHARRSGKPILMHRLILGAVDGQIVDHIDGNPLNNVRANLRFADRTRNTWNRPVRRDNASGYKGVNARPSGRYGAGITVRGERLHLGTYNTPEDAAKAYDAAARKHYGEFAVTNFAV